MTHQIVLGATIGGGVTISAISLTALTRSDSGLAPAGLATLPQPFVLVGSSWVFSFSDPAANPPRYNFAIQVTYSTGVTTAYPGLWYDPTAGTGQTFPLITGGAFTISQSGAYKGIYGNALDFGQPLSPDGKAIVAWPPDLSAFTTFTLTLTKAPDNANPVPVGGADPLVIGGTYLVATGDGQAVRFELDNSHAAKIAQGVGTQGYDFKITCANNIDTIVLAEGQCTVTA